MPCVLLRLTLILIFLVMTLTAESLTLHLISTGQTGSRLPTDTSHIFEVTLKHLDMGILPPIRHLPYHLCFNLPRRLDTMVPHIHHTCLHPRNSILEFLLLYEFLSHKDARVVKGLGALSPGLQRVSCLRLLQCYDTVTDQFATKRKSLSAESLW